MITHLELKLRDRNDRAVLVRVTHNSEALTDWLSLNYHLTGHTLHYDGREPGVLVDMLSQRTDCYTAGRLLTMCLNMADALLDMSCSDPIDGKREHPSMGPRRVLNAVE